MDDYSSLMKEYYRIEEQAVAQACSGLASAKSPEEIRRHLDEFSGALRSWLFETIQLFNARKGELDTVLSVTREELHKAQEAMQSMERENQEAAFALLRMKVQGQSAAGAPNAEQSLRARIAEQEDRLQHRDAQTLSLTNRLLQSQAELDGLVQRLDAQESLRSAQTGTAEQSREENVRLKQALAQAQEQARRREEEQQALSQRMNDEREALSKSAEQERSENAKLKQLLAESAEQARLREEELAAKDAELRFSASQRQAGTQERDAQLESLRAELAAVQTRNAALTRDLKTLQTQSARPAAPSADMEKLRQRLVELESREKARAPEQEALLKKLREAEIFNSGFMQRIGLLEAERTRLQAAQEAVLAAIPPSIQEAARLKQECAELKEHILILQGDLANVRRAHEDSERSWVETMTKQEMARLKEIADLKTELEKLRKG
ncbi:MAG: hypothetical protein WCU88_03450 [Elusimicrobiota bacterium]|jgi:chromosome segregation ATPase